MILQGFNEREFKEEIGELIRLVKMNEQFSAVRAVTSIIELDDFSLLMHEQRQEKIHNICQKYGIEN